MRHRTRQMLFADNEYSVQWEIETNYGEITCAIVSGRTVLIHDYPDARDGFEVYTQTKGVSVDSAREQMGLDERCQVRSSVDVGQGARCIKMAGHHTAHQWQKVS